MPTAPAPTDPAPVLRRRLRLLREAARLSQVDLATRSGTSQTNVSLAERVGWASGPALRKLARALDYTGDPARLMDLVELRAARSIPAPPPAERLPRHDHRDERGRFAPREDEQ